MGLPGHFGYLQIPRRQCWAVGSEAAELDWKKRQCRPFRRMSYKGVEGVRVEGGREEGQRIVE